MREKRRQLLELKKRGKARARTLMYHVATESDVLEILTDFTIDFLLKVIIATWVVEPWTFWCLKFYFIIIFLLFFFFQGYFTLQTDIYQIITSRRRSDSALVKYKAIELSRYFSSFCTCYNISSLFCLWNMKMSVLVGTHHWMGIYSMLADKEKSSFCNYCTFSYCDIFSVM